MGFAVDSENKFLPPLVRATNWQWNWLFYCGFHYNLVVLHESINPR
jgi:hypothetical protein